MIESITIKNTITSDQISIDKNATISNGYWLDEVDFGQVEGTNHTFKFIDQIGETVYNTTLESRQIQVTGWVAGWNATIVSQLKQSLNHLINPKHLLEVYANGMKIQFYPRTSVKYSPTYQNNNELVSSFLITGYCPYPLFTDANSHLTSVSYTEKLFKFPLIIPANEGIMMGIRQPSLIAEVENNGDLPIGYTIEFRAGGTVINPSLTDIGTQQFIKINKTMVNGEVITVDTREGYRHIVGTVNGVESNYFKYRTFDSSWLSLNQGINYLRYNADEGVELLEVYIIYEPGYLEVDK